MATPATTLSEQSEPVDLAAEFNCQTPDCPRPFRVVSFMVGDSTAQFHCLPCFMAWYAKVIELLIEQGILEPPSTG